MKESYAKKARKILQGMHASGVKKFVSYDLVEKNTTMRELRGFQSFIYDLMLNGEIESIKDAKGNAVKVRPSPEKTPPFIQSKVLLTQYKFAKFGKPDTTEAKKKAREYYANKIKKREVVVHVKSVWEDVWPDMHKLPKFKRQDVFFNNQCLG